MSSVEGLLELFHLIASEYGPAAAVVVLMRSSKSERTSWAVGYQALMVNRKCLNSGLVASKKVIVKVCSSWTRKNKLGVVTHTTHVAFQHGRRAGRG